MADHGESLGAHGESTHGIFLYDETLHVPLLIKRPLNRSAGRRIDPGVRLVDVAPTLLQEAGVTIPKEMQGESLESLMKSAPVGEGSVSPKSTPAAKKNESDARLDRAAYAETDYPHRAFGWSSLRALRTGKYLYIQAPERELYNQSTDEKAAQISCQAQRRWRIRLPPN